MTEPTTKAGRALLADLDSMATQTQRAAFHVQWAERIAAIEAEVREQGRREAAIRIFESNVGVPHHWLDLASPEAERRLAEAVEKVYPDDDYWPSVRARAILRHLREQP